MQIKVKDTKMHDKGYTTIDMVPYQKVPVAEAKLVLVECNKVNPVVKGEFMLNGKFYTPILISETEKIEVGDKGFDTEDRVIRAYVFTEDTPTYKKVLALPEHFSPKHLQSIVDGKIKDGDKVLVECEKKIEDNPTWKEDYIRFGIKSKEWYEIKLNSSNHITLHKVEEKVYTRDEVKKITDSMYNYIDQRWNHGWTLRRYNGWFEQNIK